MAGRPPKERSFANMLNIAINEATEQGGTKLRAVADALVTKAMGGDVAAIKEIADRLDGKSTQPISGPNGGPIQTVSLTNMSSDDLERLEALFGPLAGLAGDDAEDDTGGEG